MPVAKKTTAPATEPATVPDAEPTVELTPVQTTEAAPLEAPPAPAPAPEPEPAPVPGATAISHNPEFLGYVDHAGRPLDLEDAFDRSGIGSLVVTTRRVYAHTRPAGVVTTCTTLVFAEGTEVPRSQAEALIAEAKAR